jgi:hypothetical protein
MAKNIQSLNLLRNTSQLYATREAALATLTSKTLPPGTQDGTPVLARYKGTDGKIYTLVGFYADTTKIGGSISGETNMTVFDYEGSAANIKELQDMIGTGVTTANTVTKQLQDLSGTTGDTSATTSVAGAKKYADNKVAEELSKLTATTVAGDSKIVSDVTQANGKITATSKNLTEVKLEGYTTGGDDSAKIAASDSLGAALGKLQGQINGMDLAAVGAEGSVITSVSEEDGKVSATATPVKDVILTGYVKDTNKTGDIANTDDIEDALSKLENKAAAITIANDDKSINVTSSATGTNINVNIKSEEHVLAKGGNAGLYTDIKISAVTGTELSDLGNNVKEAYKLLGTDNTKLGDYIKIYKDSSLYKVYLGHMDDSIAGDPPVITSGTGEAALCFIYHTENGTYDLVKVNVEDFLSESEFKDGLQVNNHKVSVKVDTSSEKVTTGENVTADVLTVGTNGVKVANIQNAIDYAVSTLDASVTGGTTAGTATNGHIQVVVDEDDGKLTNVTVNEANIADASKLTELSGKTVTEIASSNGSITATKSQATDNTSKYDIITDASKIKMSGFTSTDALSGINATSSVTEAFKEVDKVITDNEQIVSAALNDLKAAKIDVITVNGKQSKTPASEDVVASVTINGADIKLDGYASGSSSAAVAPTDTVNQAIGKLENQVKAAVAGGLQAVVSSDGISVTPVENNKQTISVKLKAAETGWENPLKFDNGGLYFDSLDCGTY